MALAAGAARLLGNPAATWFKLINPFIRVNPISDNPYKRIAINIEARVLTRWQVARKFYFWIQCQQQG